MPVDLVVVFNNSSRAALQTSDAHSGVPPRNERPTPEQEPLVPNRLGEWSATKARLVSVQGMVNV